MIRAATPADHPDIRAILVAAFPTPEEADLVEQLRADGDALLELVAEDAAGIAGHILFSPLPIEGPDRTLHAAALAPLAVLPSHQNKGVGGALIRQGIETLRTQSRDAIIVLGHPDYYPRFGFTAAAAERLEAPFDGPAFMALALRPGPLVGRVRYAKAFGL